jgi:hypothetical protein
MKVLISTSKVAEFATSEVNVSAVGAEVLPSTAAARLTHVVRQVVRMRLCTFLGIRGCC